MFTTLKQKILKKKINKGLTDIAEAEIFIDFYLVAKEGIKDDGEKAKMDIKIEQLKQSIETNKSFILYAKQII